MATFDYDSVAKFVVSHIDLLLITLTIGIVVAVVVVIYSTWLISPRAKNAPATKASGGVSGGDFNRKVLQKVTAPAGARVVKIKV